MSSRPDVTRVLAGAAVGIFILLVGLGWTTDWEFGSRAWYRVGIGFEGLGSWTGRWAARGRLQTGDPVLLAMKPWEASLLGIGPGERTGSPGVDYCVVTYIDSPSNVQRRDLSIYRSYDVRPDGLEPGRDQMGCSLTTGGYVLLPIRVEVLESSNARWVMGFNREVLHVLCRSGKLDDAT